MNYLPIKKLKKIEYPFLLQQISRLKDEMEYVGEIPSDKNNVFLCVVGSRTYSTYGKDVCDQLISGLKGYPIVIVSGMAIGIDSLAHEAAIDAGMKTIAFPGSGLDPSVLYPYSRHRLAERIIETGGALISQFPTQMKSQTWTFPVRNRLMAGISQATLIIEARKGSGTLLTADYATEFSRDVMAVPGSIYSELSYGPHMLIQRGAAVITSSQDILRELGFSVTDNTTPSIDLDQLGLSEDERMICSHLVRERLTSTDIMERTSLPITRINVALTGLEIKGLIQQHLGIYQVNKL